MTEEFKNLMIDFVLPVLVLAVLAGLLFSGRDGEVKAMMAVLVGWICKAGITRKK